MEGQELKFNKARIRVHLPDRTKEEQQEKIKHATEAFMKKVYMQSRRKEVKQHEKVQIQGQRD